MSRNYGMGDLDKGAISTVGQAVVEIQDNGRATITQIGAAHFVSSLSDGVDLRRTVLGKGARAGGPKSHYQPHLDLSHQALSVTWIKGITISYRLKDLAVCTQPYTHCIEIQKREKESNRDSSKSRGIKLSMSASYHR